MKSRITPKSLVGTGALSLLVVLTLLCLAAFGVLSLSSAISDERMSQKNAEFITQRTISNASCEEKLSNIYTQLKNTAVTATDEESYYHQLAENLGEEYHSHNRTITFEEPVNEALFYEVQLSVLYHEPFYEVTKWQISIQDSEPLEEEPIKLWDGEGFSID